MLEDMAEVNMEFVTFSMKSRSLYKTTLTEGVFPIVLLLDTLDGRNFTLPELELGGSLRIAYLETACFERKLGTKNPDSRRVWKIWKLV